MENLLTYLDDKSAELVMSYVDILTEPNNAMAIGTAWGLIHVIKGLNFITKYERKETRVKYVRIWTMGITMTSLMSFKFFDDSLTSEAFNVCVFLAVSSPYLYKFITTWAPTLFMSYVGRIKNRMGVPPRKN